ncbi:MAG: PD-(D/E)XK nuclease family protein [Firmicutes bacterium]|nr:PD-(D/E)XK nuclease family protein [Bacillota bacterium]
MLHLIFGRAGSGKTEYARALLAEKARSGEGPLYFLVPEQYSFESEKALQRELGAKSLGVEVLSFTRLVDRVQREYGGMAGRRLNESGRVLLMSQALARVADSLELYRRQTENSEFIELMLHMAQECKMCGVEPARLLTAAQTMAEGTLKSKTQETGLVLTEYEALVSKSFLDPLDDLTRLANQLTAHPFFAGATVVLDSFKGFTAQEFAVLEQIIAQSADCAVTLCTDSLDDPEHGTGLFSGVKKTARRLIELARRHSAAVAPPVTLTPGARFRTENLAAAERTLFRVGKAETQQPDGSITLASALNPYEESQWIARTILRMVQSGQYRCRDFAVIVRREEDYAGILDEMLHRYGIPYFMDMPRPVDDSPLMAFVLSALESVCGGLESDSLFRCLKTGLWGISAEEIAALENYAFVWGVDRAGWLEEWKNPPDGFSDAVSEEDQLRLDVLNALREKICAPLLALRESLRGANGRTAAEAIYTFLKQTGAQEHLAEAACQLRGDGCGELADDQLRAWDLLMDLLDQLAAVLAEDQLEPTRVLRLLQLAVSAAELGHLPQSLDEVTVGGAERMRPAGPRVVFVAGANQGVFPAPPGSGSVFSEEERKQLDALGITLAQGAEEDAVDERFLAYTALCCASEQLMVSWVQATVGGEAMVPGEIVMQLRTHFPQLTVQSCAADPDFPATAGEAAQTLAAEYFRNTPRRSALQQALAGDDRTKPLLNAMQRASEGVSQQITDRKTAQELFGRRMRLSPSRVEKFYQCPFQYFCQYGLGAQPRRQAKIDSLEYGTMIHYVLEQVLRSREEAPELSGKALNRRVHDILEEYLNTRLGGREGKSERFLCLYERFEAVAALLLQAILAELEQSAFVPTDFELPIGAESEGIPALRLPLPDGGSVEVYGKVDRVDVMESGNETFVRVIDYKTGAKKFALRDVLYGINMQMLIYLLTIWKNGGARYGARSGGVIPAGVLYMPARSPRIDGVRGEKAGDAARRRLSAMCMSGIVLDDSRVLSGMEPDGKGIFIPVRIKTDGTPDARSQVISLARLGRLSQKIEKLLRQMGTQLHSGNVKADPVEKACSWCSFAGVCGRGEDEPPRELPQLSNQQVFELLERGEEG